MPFIEDQHVRLKATFRDETGALVDPTTVTFRVKEPWNGPLSTYINGIDPNVSKLSLGVYACEITLTIRGTWSWRAYGEGNMDAVGQNEFDCEPDVTE